MTSPARDLERSRTKSATPDEETEAPPTARPDDDHDDGDDEAPPPAVDQEPKDAQQSPEQGQDNEHDAAWQAVFSPEANAWYFWNSQTNETTWTNPRAPGPTAGQPAGPARAEQAVDTPALPSTSAASSHADPSSTASASSLPPIDPDLAFLDPSLARSGSSGSATQTAKFNARTGRFTVENSHLNPDRISDYQRGQRQQEAYYDVKGWEAQLEGKGIKRPGGPSDEIEGEGATRKRPSSKQVEQFRKQKEEKKRKKLTSWLTN
ncbi:hypothetical protein JCM10212_006005 [Sporobolomyces blumeae]